MFTLEPRKSKRGGRGPGDKKDRSGSKDKKENASESDNEEKKVAKTDGKQSEREKKNNDDIRCYNCDKKGHKKADCKER